FSLDFDFIDHVLILTRSNGRSIALPLRSESVATFFGRCMGALDAMGIEVNFDPRPNELPDATPFHLDQSHHTYDPSEVHNCWQALVRINNVFKEFRTRFVGKSSPVHFFWGSFDLAITRFSGRRAPEHPGGVLHLPDKVV